MMWRVLIAAACTALIVGIAAGCSGGENSGKHPSTKDSVGFNAETILHDRTAKDEEFRSEYSPLPREQWAEFKGLHYYEPAEQYCVQAQLQVLATPDTVQIAATKSDDIRTMVRYGILSFSIEGEQCKLTAYKNTGETAKRYPTLLFVPFQDKTTGVETYDAGRYIDLEERAGTTQYWLDFNRAYNPYCAYNQAYSCPLVPEENILAVAIRAGEKNYGH